MTIVALGVTANNYFAVSKVDEPIFVPTISAAEILAKIEKKDVLVILSADWCPPCNRFKKDYDTIYKKVEEKYVVVYMNIDKHKGYKKFKEEFGLNNQVPQFIILSEDHKYKKGLVGYGTKNSLLDFLNAN